MTNVILELIRRHRNAALVIAACALILAYFGPVIHRNLSGKNSVELSVAFVNEYKDVGENSRICKAYETYAGEEHRNDRVLFDANYFFDLSTERGFGNAYYQKLVAALEASTVDAVVLEEENLNGIARGGRLMRLDDERAEHIFQRYQKALYYYQTDEGEELPAGIRLPQNSLTEYLGYRNDIFLIVAPQCEHMGTVEVFLGLLMKGDG